MEALIEQLVKKLDTSVKLGRHCMQHNKNVVSKFLEVSVRVLKITCEVTKSYVGVLKDTETQTQLLQTSSFFAIL